MSEALQDRLKLTEARIEAMAEGLRQIAALEDPIGEVLSMKTVRTDCVSEKESSSGCCGHYL